VIQRNVIYTELHALLAQQFSGDSSKIAVRFGQLMTLMLDLVVNIFEGKNGKEYFKLTKEQNKVIQISKINFDKKFPIP